ncbi:MAG: ATP-binding protein [Chlamydiae bacterium]|nr:ATP-binding protein [Chlamydiota bacterium]MBI3266056.1 ATP-binding protein [Chlamydiota bacterium]
MALENRIEITFESHPRWLQHVRAMVRSFCSLVGFSKPQVHAVVLAVDEACTNVIRHSYEGKPRCPIFLECESKNHTVEFLLKDQGPAIDLKKIQHRSLDDVKPGGLGVFFIHKAMDKVEYKREKGFNVLRMLKHAKKK